MDSYYRAVGVTAVSLIVLLRYLFRNKPVSQHKLIYMAVGTTTAIALLLPTLLNQLNMVATVLLMAGLAAVAGTFIPVSDLLARSVLPDKAASISVDNGDKARLNEGVAVQEVIGDVPADCVENLLAQPELEGAGQIDVMTEEISDEPVEAVSEEPAEAVSAETEEGAASEPTEKDGEEAEGSAGEFSADRKDAAFQLPGIVLPQIFSATLSEVMLMNAYLALGEGKEEESLEAFSLVCQRGNLAEQKMNAYIELKALLLEHGRLRELATLEEKLLEAGEPLTEFHLSHIQQHNHYLKHLSSLCHAHGVPLNLPYSAMPDELKDMAKTYQ